jgi:hypothetical protein
MKDERTLKDDRKMTRWLIDDQEKIDGWPMT